MKSIFFTEQVFTQLDARFPTRCDESKIHLKLNIKQHKKRNQFSKSHFFPPVIFLL